MSKIATHFKLSALLCFFCAGADSKVSAQPVATGIDYLFSTPLAYTAGFVERAPVIDGDLSDDVWKNAGWSDAFVDIEGDRKPLPPLNTRMKMVWDKNYLFIAAELEEPDVWGKLTERDAVIYHDNDFEVFIDTENTGHQYFELEFNALNTVFDLFLAKPYRSNSGALISWDAPGLRSAVKVQGTLNRAGDKDKGWTVEIAVPFKALSIGDNVKVPKEGTMWRINFSRVQWDTDIINGKYVKKKDKAGKNLPEHNWVWSPQGLINMHMPERWGYLYFSRKSSSAVQKNLDLPYTEKQRQYLWLVYYRQKEFFNKHKRYAPSLKDLGIDDEALEIGGVVNQIQMEATSLQFSATIGDKRNNSILINEEGLVTVL